MSRQYGFYFLCFPWSQVGFFCRQGNGGQSLEARLGRSATQLRRRNPPKHHAMRKNIRVTRYRVPRRTPGFGMYTIQKGKAENVTEGSGKGSGKNPVCPQVPSDLMHSAQKRPAGHMSSSQLVPPSMSTPRLARFRCCRGRLSGMQRRVVRRCPVIYLSFYPQNDSRRRTVGRRCRRG